MKGFQNLHPVFLMGYFAAVSVLTMITFHPVILSVSLLFAMLFFLSLAGIRKFGKSMVCFLPLFVLIAATNPFFSKGGETVLLTIFNQPYTLEALLAGVSVATLLTAVFYWMMCYNEVMTSDKFLFLFGKGAPKLALIISMSLSFVPKLSRQTKKIYYAQKAMGLFAKKSLFSRIAAGFRVISVLLGWSLENSMDTADCMKAKGYGLKGRTSFSMFRFTLADGLAAAVTGFFLIIVFIGLSKQAGDFSYYPVISQIKLSAVSVITYAALMLFMAFPVLLQMKETFSWRLSLSKI